MVSLPAECVFKGVHGLAEESKSNGKTGGEGHIVKKSSERHTGKRKHQATPPAVERPVLASMKPVRVCLSGRT